MLIFELQKLDGVLGSAVELLVVAFEEAHVAVRRDKHLDLLIVGQSLEDLLNRFDLERQG